MASKRKVKAGLESESEDEQQFVFVHVDEDTDAATQKMFRAHAMRVARWRNRLGTKTGAEDAASIPYKIGRYRLAPQPPLPRETNHKRELVAKARSGDPSVAIDVPSVSLQPHFRDTMVITPSEGRLDPFDSAPVKLGMKQQRLLHYCS